MSNNYSTIKMLPGRLYYIGQLTPYRTEIKLKTIEGEKNFFDSDDYTETIFHLDGTNLDLLDVSNHLNLFYDCITGIVINRTLSNRKLNVFYLTSTQYGYGSVYLFDENHSYDSSKSFVIGCLNDTKNQSIQRGSKITCAPYKSEHHLSNFHFNIPNSGSYLLENGLFSKHEIEYRLNYTDPPQKNRYMTKDGYLSNTLLVKNNVTDSRYIFRNIMSYIRYVLGDPYIVAENNTENNDFLKNYWTESKTQSLFNNII